MTLEIRSFDHGRDDSFRAVSTRLHKVVTSLGAFAPELAEWRGAMGDDLVPLASMADAEGVVAASARGWRMGEKELVAYGPWAVANHRGLRVAKLSLVGGIEPIDLQAWIPNRVELELSGAAEFGLRSDPKLLFALVQAIVSIWQPVWAVVASDGVPRSPVAPFADGSPSVGWVTYLSKAFPPLPPLPSPSTAHDLGTGVLIVAHSSEPKAEAIAKLEAALRDANVLLSARELRGGVRG